MAFSCNFLYKISICSIPYPVFLQYVNSIELSLYNMKDRFILLYHIVFNIRSATTKCCNFASET